MTKKEILEDFVVYYFMNSYDELLSNIVYFFEYPPDVFDKQFEEKTNYLSFLKLHLNLNDLAEDKQTVMPVKKLSDLLTSQNINDLVSFLNKEFREGFPDGDKDGVYGGNYELEITKEDLINVFQDYLELHLINPNIYISFLLQLFRQIGYRTELKFNTEKEKIDSLYQKLELLPESLKSDFKIHNDEKLKQNLFESIIDRPFQFQGFYDKKGMYINQKISFKKWVEISINQEFDYDINEIKKNVFGNDFLIYQYFRFKVFDESIYLGEKYDADNKKSELAHFKIENADLIDYLKDKKFNSDEIDGIINFISGGHFDIINKRSIESIKQIDFFRLCYLFYIFDFLKDKRQIKFDKQKDIESLIFNDYSLYNTNWNNQFFKYFKSLSDVNNYPFTRVDKTYKLIEDDLKIEKGKLKPIPKTKYMSIQ